MTQHLVRGLAVAATPVLTPVLTGVWPLWMRHLGHTCLVWSLAATPLLLFGQDRAASQWEMREASANTERLRTEFHASEVRVSREIGKIEGRVDGQADMIRQLQSDVAAHSNRLWLLVLGGVGAGVAAGGIGSYAWRSRNGNGKIHTP